MSNKKNNLFLSSIKSSGSKSELSSSSSAASSPSNASTNPASPAPDLLFVNRTYRENLNAWHSLAPEVFHAGTTRSPSPAVTATPPSAALDANTLSLFTSDSNKSTNSPFSSNSPSASQKKYGFHHRKLPSFSTDTFSSLHKDLSVAPTTNSTSSQATPKRRKISLPNEKRRMKILRELDLLDSAPEEAFDRITNLASRIFKCPIAAISFMDETSQFFKSRLGAPMNKLPRDVSFNTLTFLDDREGVIVIRDTHYDDRFEPIAEEAPQKEDNGCNNDNNGDRQSSGHHRRTPSGSVNTDIRPPFIPNVHDNERYISTTTHLVASEGESGKSQLSGAYIPESNQPVPALPPAFHHVHHLPQEIAQISKPPAEIPRHHSPLHYHQFRHLKAHVRFFATTNIFVNRVKIGCLTICDVVPHYHFSANDELMLLDLAGMISDLLEDRRNMKAEEERKTFQTHQEALLRIQVPLQRVCYCAELVGQGISEVFYGPNELDTCAIYNDDLPETATTNYIIKGDLRNGSSVTINTADVNVDSAASFMTDKLNAESTDIACISSMTMEDTVASHHGDALSTDVSPSSSDKLVDNDSTATTINNESSVKKNFQLSVVTDRTITDKEATISFNTHVVSQKNGATSWYLSPHLAASQYHVFSASSDMDTPMTGPSIKLNNMDLPYSSVHHMNTNAHPFLPTYPPSIDDVNVATQSILPDDSGKEDDNEDYPLYSYPSKDIFLQGLRDHVAPALQAFVSAVHFLDTTIEHTLVQHLQAFWSQRQRSNSQTSPEGCSLSCTPVSNSGSSSNTPHGSDSSTSSKSETNNQTENGPSGSVSTALVATTNQNNVNSLLSVNYANVHPVLKFDEANRNMLLMRTSGPLYSGISPLSTGTIVPIKTASKMGVVNSANANNYAKYE